MNPKLSIIIPVYQAECYLESCIESILNQEMSDFELILIDDGSKDGSGSICDQYALKDSRIKVIHKENEGQATARNDGINKATGKYIGFVDNDDVIKPEMFSLLLRNMEQNKADISSCSYIKQYPDGSIADKKFTFKQYLLDNREGVREILSRELLDIYVWTKIYDKSFLDKNNIRFESGKIDEDILFNFEAFSHASLTIHEDVPGYVYFWKDTSTSSTYYQKDMEKYMRATMYRVDKILNETEKKYPEWTYLAKRQKIIYYLSMLNAMVRLGKKNCEHIYREVLYYLKANRRQLLSESESIGVNKTGVWLLLLLPPSLYYFYRKNN